MSETRCYLIIDVSAPRTVAQWNALKAAVRNKPMLAALRDLGNVHDQPHLKVIMARMSLDLRYALVRFCIDPSDVTSALATLNAQCALHSITGNAQAKFAAEIQFELREAAVDLGYTPTQSLALSASIIGYHASDRDVAIAAAQAYITANAANWEESVI